MVKSIFRSRIQARASGSQPRPSQSQRPTRNGRVRGDSDDEDDDDYGDAGQDGSVAMDVNDDEDGQDGGSELLRKINGLVRLALFNEYKRMPLKREEISKKVLGPNGRSFNAVFAGAQDVLRLTFGMELVELQSRAGMEEDAMGASQEDRDAQRMTGLSKKAAAAGSKTYILRSVLDPVLIEHANLTDEQILAQEMAEVPEEEEEDEDAAPRSYGSIIAWNTADQLGPTGLLYVILALILVSGRVISDMDLRNYLKRLGVPFSGTVDFNAQSTHPMLPMEQYLANLIRQGYLDRQQVGDVKKGKGKGTKRTRLTQAEDGDSSVSFEWRWGNRAQSEVGEKGIAQFVAEFMVGGRNDDDDDDQDGEDEDEGLGRRRRGRERRETMDIRLERMLKGVEKAAGGQLADLK